MSAARTSKRTDTVTVKVAGLALIGLIAAAVDGELPPGGVLEIAIPGDRKLRIGATEDVTLTYTAERPLDPNAESEGGK